jgi:predicted DNA-binding transcriptional regulator YafY
MGAVVTAVQLKLMASLPAELRDRAGRVAERFHLDAPAWYRKGDRAPYLSAVAGAVWNNRAVRMRYLRWAEPREITRIVEPYGLVLKAGHWYLVAGSTEGLRTYRISRIVDLHVLDERFERPEGFDLAECWQNCLRLFDARRHQGEATLRLSPSVFCRLPQLWESAMADAAQRTATSPDADGWIRVAIPIESVEQALPELLKLGADAEILAPAGLRERMTRTLDTLTRVYRRPV